ncbi:MAG: D-alanyl-D-alanine carboxypeptidase/D-alanyl-D-alanine endopeptidase [Acidimicrobiia bacterium]
MRALLRPTVLLAFTVMLLAGEPALGSLPGPQLDPEPWFRPWSPVGCTPHRSVTDPSGAPLPRDLQSLITQGLADPRLDRVRLGLSVWMDGYGEIASDGPDRRLLPASNQKILTAMGVMSLLDPNATLFTEVQAAAPVAGGTLPGDLVLVGGGDPTLARDGPHSLEELASQVRGTGITSVLGDVVVDESRYDRRRRAEGWLDWQLPTFVGPLSALTVGHNQYRSDPDFLSDPAAGNGQLFVDALAGHGVAVQGAVVRHRAPVGTRRLAGLPSAPFGELVGSMLRLSDNTIAELLLKEVGLAERGWGSTRAGLEAVTEAVEGLCVPLKGFDADGSGLSRRNWRSAREWRTLLQAAQAAPWWEAFLASLPVAAESGTLAGRFHGTAAAGNLRAKTGTIVEGRALSGFFTTEGGREVFFSAIVNGNDSRPAMEAIDGLIGELAAYPG